MISDVVWGYMDETGHSKDQKQRFNGMAGLIAPSVNWAHLERKWKATLTEFKIPYFHMKEWTHSTGHFIGWSKAKREKLYAKLLRKMESVYPFPLGTILSMEDFRRLNNTQQAWFDDPYYLGFGAVLAYIDFFLDKTGASLDAKALIVFSDQVEFRHRALEYYETSYTPELSSRINPPAFADMRKVVALQAADIVAYEFYKECERLRYRPNDNQRYGYGRLVKMTNRLGFHQPLLHFQEHKDLLGHATKIETYFKRLTAMRDKMRESQGRSDANEPD